MMTEPDHITNIASQLSLKQWQVKSVTDLMDDDNTVHFIARYRKEKTGNLDENVIREIIQLRERSASLYEGKLKALKNIDEQGKLTEELEAKIENAGTLAEVEDLYAPYKRKKKTKADIAREKGFDVVAIQIRNQEVVDIPKELLDEYSSEEIVTGAKDIVSQEIADDAELKDFVRQNYMRRGTISAKHGNAEKFDEKQKREVHKFKIYATFQGNVKTLKSYQILALNRGENLGIVKVSMEKDDVFYDRFRNRIVVKKELPQRRKGAERKTEDPFCQETKRKDPEARILVNRRLYSHSNIKEENTELLDDCIKDGYAKTFASVEREVRNALTERASADAIKVFQDNLKNLLMLKPHFGQSVLAIDPGYRTGCKVCVLEKNGAPICFSKFFLDKSDSAIRILGELLSKHAVDIVVIGNGTGSREASELVKDNFDSELALVNESGASVYSASEAGQEEFPDTDVTDRGTISIGRRYIDSLSELVKIPVISIGVGMYQHDMNQKELEQKLSDTVEDVVNLVGINVNTASVHLLSYVSGLNKRISKKIFGNSPYSSREKLKKVLSKKAYQQCVGFLRVPESENPFDRTAIHPEQYDVAGFIVDNMGEDDVFGNHGDELERLYPGITSEVVADIVGNYRNAGKELRQHEGTLKSQASIKMEDLKIGDLLDGVVRNVTRFGAFVDIGLKSDALIHISQLADRFVKNPLDIVSVGQQLKARVINVDLETKRVSLSLKKQD
jgi:uncharacterized protein